MAKAESWKLDISKDSSHVYKQYKRNELTRIDATLFTYSTHKTNNVATLYDELSFSKPADSRKIIVEAQIPKNSKLVKIVVSCAEACSDARGQRLFVPFVNK